VIDFYPYRERYRKYRRLDAEPRSRESILAELREMAGLEDEIGDRGQVSGSIYHGDHDHYRFLSECFGLFAHANVLQRDMYPSATKLEGEIIAMTSSLLHHEGAAGVVTSGGTESLINPLLVYRERGRRRGIARGEVILPVTAHVALAKGAHLLGLEVVHAPVRDDWLVDVAWVRRHVTSNTVALVGSAGSYPHGLIDPIAELSDIALEHDLGLHVDGCLGGFILAFGERLGLPIPIFDFRLPGVTSISADTHKYGFALKGTSVLLYRTPELRRLQYFNYGSWPGGIYVSPGLAGSRSGGLVAATWAAMVSLGESGYLAIARAIFDTASKLRRGIEEIPELHVFGDPTFLVAFGSRELDVYHVNDHLVSRGWRLNAIQLPPGLHFCVTRPNTAPGVVERFLQDLRHAVDYAKQPDLPPPRSGALYGLGGSPGGEDVLQHLLAAALDAMHEVAPE
jgi:glutamate/tyrosine decarboxylase-like PLP-dependent enzyme